MSDSVVQFAVHTIPFLVIGPLMLALLVWTFKSCWNRVLPSVFGLKEIDFLDSAAFLILLAIVFSMLHGAVR
ncbi:hypothetical protein H8K38_07290 [Undibacterium sp. FT79W]|uniref:hypothetical protein n=1 Tax=Undibacterium sp. FT79W TaxID=2762296 RepID=UPI00164B9C08|nr:hypothetical protein [Undibacterium sp. FT79W]MBC3877606.1 hypothetical protein [Undibacterium sp. FT79W]